MSQKIDNEYRMRIGETIIGIECPSEEYASELEEYFGVKSTVADPHVSLKLEIIAHEDIPEIPNSLFASKKVTGESFSIAGDLISGNFDSESGAWDVRVKNILTKYPTTRVFEQFLYQAYYSARKKCDYDGYLIHSSGVVRKGKGFLFVGAMETGKTTIANFSLNNTVLNDEICLVSFNDENVSVHDTPFNGFFKGKSAGDVPLSVVFLLTHGNTHQIHEISRAIAVKTILTQIVPPVGLEEELTNKTRVSMMELADRLSATVPVRVLEFSPDPGFWKVIDREFISTQEGSNG